MITRKVVFAIFLSICFLIFAVGFTQRSHINDLSQEGATFVKFTSNQYTNSADTDIDKPRPDDPDQPQPDDPDNPDPDADTDTDVDTGTDADGIDRDKR